MPGHYEKKCLKFLWIFILKNLIVLSFLRKNFIFHHDGNSLCYTSGMIFPSLKQLQAILLLYEFQKEN